MQPVPLVPAGPGRTALAARCRSAGSLNPLARLWSSEVPQRRMVDRGAVAAVHRSAGRASRSQPHPGRGVRRRSGQPARERRPRGRDRPTRPCARARRSRGVRVAAGTAQGHAADGSGRRPPRQSPGAKQLAAEPRGGGSRGGGYVCHCGRRSAAPPEPRPVWADRRRGMRRASASSRPSPGRARIGTSDPRCAMAAVATSRVKPRAWIGSYAGRRSVRVAEGLADSVEDPPILGIVIRCG